MAPIVPGLLVKPAMRSENSLGKATVMALNVVELAMMVMTRDATTRHMTSRDTRGAAAVPLLAGAWCRTHIAKATPSAAASKPGRMKAQRQPSNWQAMPVTSADDATPRLPQTPLM